MNSTLNYPELREVSAPLINNFPIISFLEGLEIEVRGDQTQRYRFDGAVKSIPKNLIKVLEEFGFEVLSHSAVFESYEKATGECRHAIIKREKVPVRISVPFYLKISAPVDVYHRGHEDMHAVQFLGLYPAFLEVERRLKYQGYPIKLSPFDIEEQANIAGVLRLIEEGISINRIKKYSPINETYKRVLRSKA